MYLLVWLLYSLLCTWWNEGDYIHTSCTIRCYDFAYLIPAIFLSLQVTDTFLPQLAIFGQTTFAFDDGVKVIPEGTYLLHALDTAVTDLGFKAYTEPGNLWNMFMLNYSINVRYSWSSTCYC